MDEEERGYSRIAYYLAKSTTRCLDAVVVAESGKGPEQRLELNDIANICREYGGTINSNYQEEKHA
jgi:hypothetical protein